MTTTDNQPSDAHLLMWALWKLRGARSWLLWGLGCRTSLTTWTGLLMCSWRRSLLLCGAGWKRLPRAKSRSGGRSSTSDATKETGYTTLLCIFGSSVPADSGASCSNFNHPSV
jgi:hypothetical protein